MSFTIKVGLVRDLNPGPLAPKARIIPLDQRANLILERGDLNLFPHTHTEIQPWPDKKVYLLVPCRDRTGDLARVKGT